MIKDFFKWYFIFFKVDIKIDIISTEKIIVTDSTITLCAPPRCYVTFGHTIFTVTSYDKMNYVCIHSERWHKV